jgi:hypothetical protein
LRLRLNTAELNTFALTLFLLCARRIDNPLRSIVLDDPLQNMDELTVTTVARGLARLMRVWQKLDGNGPVWRLVILLHSEEDVESFRAEAQCATYLLPWLSPQLLEKGAVQEARLQPSRLKPELQPLTDVLKEAAPPAVSSTMTAAMQP